MKLIRFALPLLLFAAVLPLGRAAAEDNKKPEPISPTDGVIKLFNGKDLTGLYTWLKDTEYDDPRQVFTVHDGLLHISGDGWGGVVTKNEYKNYHLVVEFKWGDRTWDTRKDRTKDSGVLVHCVGHDGNYSNIWMNSIEAQIIEGGIGDILAVRGKYPDGTPMPISATAEVETDPNGQNRWKEGGERRTIQGGRINWWGRDPAWKDVLGFRGKNDVDNPDGWNRMDVICDGDRIVIKVNGVKVNEAFDLEPSAGKILIQSEAAEMFVRRWELWPLGKAPEFDPASLEK